MAKIGIDFGTTNSLMVAYDKSKEQFIYFSKISKGIQPTSSTVWYHDNKVIVGNEARESMYKLADVEGHHFERSIKLKLGTGKNVNIFGESVQPYKVASTIIQKLKNDALEKQADKAGVDLDSAVFTIPINFNGKQRKDLRMAAHEAGIEVNSFIHEPFAAIVGYYYAKENGSHSKVLSKLKQMNRQYLLVFDWGGGTLDITVCQIKNGKIVELGTAELTDVAGDKFDEDLANLVWNRFINKYGSKYSTEYLEKIKKQKWGRLIGFAERSKKQLSDEEETEILVENITENEDIDEIVTRKEFEDIISNTLLSASNKVKDALKIAGISSNDIAHVLLTGGTCYIPAVQNMMKEDFGHRVETVKDADLLIAQGAAVISEMGWLPFLTKDILIQLSDNSYWPIFERNMPIGADKEATRTEEFICVDSRTKNAKVIVCEGLDQNSDKMLTVLNVPLLGNKDFGDNLIVEATIDKNIILTIRAHSTFVTGYKQPEEDYTKRVTKEAYQLCFGLDFGGEL